jgi:adenosylcobinamide kinase/adenosylcobinamide-phosphate guanylyltransferase
MATKIVLVTGGQRSGKSRYAQELALRLAPNPIYVATSRIWDDDFRERVERHKADRGAMWTNIEEEKLLGKLAVAGRVVVVDCVTLWATNFFFDLGSSVDEALALLKEELGRFTEQPATFIFITNEIGMGGHAENAIQRKFTDLQGWLNQHIAALADEVVLMVAGIPVRVK